MIRLSKTKVDDRYNISDDGVITDLQGNVQKTYYCNNRPSFKGQYIHRILIWTKFGWYDGKKFHIHHKDGNKLNNNINNLQLLTSIEHRKLYHPSEETKNKISKNYNRKNFNYSEETKKKMSESHKGKVSPNKGISLSKEQKIKISNSLKGKKPVWTGKHWKKDPITGKRIYY